MTYPRLSDAQWTKASGFVVRQEIEKLNVEGRQTPQIHVRTAVDIETTNGDKVTFYGRVADGLALGVALKHNHIPTLPVFNEDANGQRVQRGIARDYLL